MVHSSSLRSGRRGCESRAGAGRQMMTSGGEGGGRGDTLGSFAAGPL